MVCMVPVPLSFWILRSIIAWQQRKYKRKKKESEDILSPLYVLGL